MWHQTELAASFFNERLADGPQQVIAILLPNSIEFILAYLAIIHSGHIALPLDPAYKKIEHEAILKQLGARIIITDPLYATQVGIIKAETIMIDELKDRKMADAHPLRLPAKTQIASLTFTSGTTSAPKAVPNTHSNHLWNIEACSQAWDWTHDDTLLVNVPLSHMLGVVMAISGSIYHANTMYLHKWFDAEKTLQSLASGKISFYTHAASAFVKLTQTPGEYDLSKVRLCVSGAAPLPPAVWNGFKNRFGLDIRETYGSSETGRIAANRIDEPVMPGSPGKPLPGVSLELSENNEVLVKSPGVFPGYYRNKAATDKSRTADGYWKTGDIAELKDGYIFLKGRKQERIRRFGYTISPRDVEWAMHKHPDIDDIYVMGRQKSGQPDDELIFFVVAKKISDEEINRFCKQNLLFAWRPDKIVRLDELPRTRSGKTRIGALKVILKGAA